MNTADKMRKIMDFNNGLNIPKTCTVRQVTDKLQFPYHKMNYSSSKPTKIFLLSCLSELDHT